MSKFLIFTKFLLAISQVLTYLKQIQPSPEAL